MTEDTSPEEWRPRTLADLLRYNRHEVLDGFLDGLGNTPEPGENRSPAYRQGWRAGSRDKGYGEGDRLDAVLAAAWARFIDLPGYAAILAEPDPEERVRRARAALAERETITTEWAHGFGSFP